MKNPGMRDGITSIRRELEALTERPSAPQTVPDSAARPRTRPDASGQPRRAQSGRARTTAKQAALIRQLRRELGLPKGSITKKRRKAAAQIDRLIAARRAQDAELHADQDQLDHGLDAALERD